MRSRSVDRPGRGRNEQNDLPSAATNLPKWSVKGDLEAKEEEEKDGRAQREDAGEEYMQRGRISKHDGAGKDRSQ